MKSLPNLDGLKVSLRPITINDTELVVKWRNNPSVKCNFVFQEEFTYEMHEKWLNTKVKYGEVVQYIIIDKDTGNAVGSVYFRDIDGKNQSAEFGIFIGEDSIRGKGLGSEATKIFTNFGFDYLKLHRIMLRVFSDNLQAQKAYQNAGFNVEGIFKDMIRQNNKYRDMTFMAIINSKE